MNKKKRVMVQFITLICVCAVVLGINMLSAKIDRSSKRHEEITLAEGWNVCINGTQMQNVNLDDARFDIFNRGDSFIITNTLPDKIPKHPVLKLYVIHGTIDLYVGDELIYVYGHEEYETGKLLGYGYHFINLSDSDAGKSIRIEMTITENEAFSCQTSPILADSNYVHRDFIVQHRFQIATIFFLIMFGLIVFVLSLFYSRKNKELISLAGAGLFSLTIGCWSLCTADLIESFTYSLYAKSFLEYASLYWASFFILSYFIPEMKRESKKRWMVFHLIIVAQAVFSAGATVLQLFNVIRFPSMLKVCHFLMVCLAMFMIGRFIIDMFKGKVSYSVLVFGFEVLAAFAFYDLIRFNIQKYMVSASDDHYVSLVYVGVLVFVLSMLIDFCVKYIKGMYEKIEKETLEKLAYTDSMTELANRRSLEEKMDEIDGLGTDYYVVTFDLNNLKKVNDSLGHDEGDRYIRGFADALGKVFLEFGLVARVGGDEFVSILYENSQERVKTLLAKLDREMDLINESNPEWKMTVAYGFCGNKDTGITSIRQASKIADERMYRRKAEMKI